jgi:hypothetical protein
MRIPGERKGKTLIPKLEKILSRGPKTTHEIMDLIYELYPRLRSKPSTDKVSSIVRHNPNFSTLTMVKHRKSGRPKVHLWCLTRRLEIERKAIIKTIFDQINQ